MLRPPLYLITNFYSEVVEILVSRAAKAHGISEDEIAKVDVTSRKKKRKVNGKGK